MVEDENTNNTEQEGAGVPESNKGNTETDNDELKALKERNDKIEAEMLRAEQLRAKQLQGGKSRAGEPILSEEEILEEEGKKAAEEIVNAFR